MISQTKIGIHCIVLFFLSIQLAFATKTIYDKYLNKHQLFEVPHYHVPHYKVTLVVDTKTYYSHAGQVDINIHIDSFPSPPVFNLDIQALKINNVEARGAIDWKLFRSHYDFKVDILEIWFNDSMPAGEYTLHIEFESASTNNLFQSQHRNSDNRSLIMTKSTRQLFPCWESNRGTFDITVIHSIAYVALSNTKLSKEHTSEHHPTHEADVSELRVWSTFETTPIMLAKEVMIVLLPATQKNKSKYFNPTINTWCKSDTTSTLSFAKNVIYITIRGLYQYTHGIKPTSKIDHIVIWDAPETMARLGIIIYRESDVTYNKTLIDLKDLIDVKFQVVTTIISKVAHQWFGGLVMTEKTHRWLSGSFLKFFTYYFLNQALEGPWFRMLHLTHSLILSIENDFGIVGQDDDRWSMPPVLCEDSEIFDVKKKYIYNKGFLLLRMLQQIIGETTFQDGVTKFLHDNTHKFVTTDDLWSAMQTALSYTSKPKIDIKTMMDSYLIQRGYPMVHVEQDGLPIGENVYMKISQGPNYSYRDLKYLSPDIYLTWITNSNFNGTSNMWLKIEYVFMYIIINYKEFLIINLEQIGYYRVRYQWKNWEKIRVYLNSDHYTNIHALNRAQLIFEICKAFTAERIDWDFFLSIIKYLSRETNYVPWVSMLECVNLMDYPTFFQLEKNKMHLMEVATYFDGILNKIGYEEDPKNFDADDLTISMRLKLADKACKLGNPTCRNAARNKLENYLADPTAQVLQGWEYWMFCYGLKTANFTISNQVFVLYNETKDKAVLRYLACSEDPDIITNQLLYTITDNRFDDLQVSRDIIEIIIQNLIHNTHVFNYFLNRHKFFLIRSKYIGDLLYFIISNLYSEDLLEKVCQFTIDLQNTTNSSIGWYSLYKDRITEQFEIIRTSRESSNRVLIYNNDQIV